MELVRNLYMIEKTNSKYELSIFQGLRKICLAHLQFIFEDHITFQVNNLLSMHLNFILKLPEPQIRIDLRSF